MRRRLFAAATVCLMLLAVLAGCGRSAGKAGKQDVTIRISTHWGQGYQEHLQPFMDEYTKLNPHVKFQYEAVPFAEFFKKVQVQAISGDPPDIWHLYSLWGPQMAESGQLAEAPSDVQSLVKKEFVKPAQSGVTFDGKMYGVPTEIDNYMLLYNKRLLAEAGFNAPPKNWDELYQVAKKTTKFNADGTIDQAGMAFMKGWDSAVVHPFLAFLLSNNGQYISADGKKVSLDSKEAVETLEMQVRLISEKLADPALDYNKLFPAGKMAMVVSAPFVKAGYQKTMGDAWKDVGVAPLPYGKSGKAFSVSYTWFWSVAKNSKNKEEAWKFIKFLQEQAPGQKGSRMGNFLIDQGIIPSKQADYEALGDKLKDPFMKAFVDQLANTVAEPNLSVGQEMKTVLQREIENAWYGKKTPADALKTANEALNKLLAETK